MLKSTEKIFLTNLSIFGNERVKKNLNSRPRELNRTIRFGTLQIVHSLQNRLIISHDVTGIVGAL